MSAAAAARRGLASVRRRRAPDWLWAIPILLTLSVLLVNSETPRFRAPIDPYLIMLAASTIVAIAERVRAHASAPGLGRARAA